ncbi:type II toxin-antitoxin system Phd/YefM family antitoxin [Frankia sp. AiPs1]|uniref:type II toxin-antitoxin system Phd/YefM family antitoxin n=1 Tax=Frankia sp. AiPs1 TaxID=573493 RepID=UPI0035AB8E95
MVPTTDTFPPPAVKARLSELVTRVQQHHDQVTVMRNDRPAVAVVPAEERESLHENPQILPDTETVSFLPAAAEEIARNPLLDHASGLRSCTTAEPLQDLRFPPSPHPMTCTFTMGSLIIPGGIAIPARRFRRTGLPPPGR